MAASTEDMQTLHKIVVQSITNRITQDMEDDVPTDAATLGAAIKMLKDNNITADPADSNDLADLRKKLVEQREGRKSNVVSIIDAAKADIAKVG